MNLPHSDLHVSQGRTLCPFCTREKLRDADNQPGLLHGIILLKPYEREELASAIEKTLLRPAPDQR